MQIKNSLDLIVGPVCCGKSAELIRRIVRYQIANFKVLLIKPNIDTRSDNIKSRNGTELKAIPLKDIKDIYKCLDKNVYDVIGIDEAQFFSGENNIFYNTVFDLLKKRFKVVISALDSDFKGHPFGEIPNLMTISDNITKLNAICMRCHSDNAIFSQKLRVGGNQIEVGDLDLYQPRCLNCFVPGGIE